MYSSYNILKLFHKTLDTGALLNLHLAPSFKNVYLKLLESDLAILADDITDQIERVNIEDKPNIDEIYSVELDKTLLNELSGHLEFGNFIREGYVIQAFYEYVQKGYDKLHAFPLYCISNINIIGHLIKNFKENYNIVFKEKYIFNEMFFFVSKKYDNEEEITFIMFTTQPNIKTIITTKEQVFPFSQLYILTKSGEKLSQLQSRLITTILNEICAETTLFKFLKSIPYNLNSFPFYDLAFQNDIVLKKINTHKAILSLLPEEDSNLVYVGQFLNNSISIEECKSLLRQYMYPSSLIFLKFLNGKKSLKTSIKFYIIFDNGKQVINFNCKQLKNTKFSVYQTVFRLMQKDKNSMALNRLSPRVYLDPVNKNVIITNKAIFNIDSIINQESFINTKFRTCNLSSYIEKLQSYYKFDSVSTKTLFEYKDFKFVKIRFTCLTIYTFASDNSDIDINLFEFLHRYINSLNFDKLTDKNFTMDLFNLYSLLEPEFSELNT